jgi:hypothetical protein
MHYSLETFLHEITSCLPSIHKNANSIFKYCTYLFTCCAFSAFLSLEIYLLLTYLFTNWCRQNQSQTIMSAGKHADLIRKVESLSALTDSNRLLREEKQKIEGLVHTATTEAEQARASVASLQVSVRIEGARPHRHYRG